MAADGWLLEHDLIHLQQSSARALLDRIDHRDALRSRDLAQRGSRATIIRLSHHPQ